MDTREKKEKQHEWYSTTDDPETGDYWDDHCHHCFKPRDLNKDETDQGKCK